MKKNKKSQDEELVQDELAEENVASEGESTEEEKSAKPKKELNLNDFGDVGHNIISNVLTLYRSGKYFREKEFMAKKLLELGYEAGRSVSRVASSNDYADDARKSIDDLVFLLDTMVYDNIFTGHRIAKTMEAIGIANNLLNSYVYISPESYNKGYENGSYGDANPDGFNDDYYD